jgi:predicted RNA-binding Zn ribbon-like protein
MRLSEKYPVPREFALLYEFVNSLDLRRFVEQGAAHRTRDELATIPYMERWMRVRNLLEPDAHITETQHRDALELREAIRAFLRTAPADRLGQSEVAVRLNRLSEAYPLVLKIVVSDAVTLQPVQGSNGLGRIVAELYLLATTGQLDRIKVCESDECNWIFYDRSKPGSRRWCSATLCGNRQKTRSYRQRRREASVSPHPS